MIIYTGVMQLREKKMDRTALLDTAKKGDADEILKENLIGNNKIMVNDKMNDDERNKNSNDLNVVKNVPCRNRG